MLFQRLNNLISEVRLVFEFEEANSTRKYFKVLDESDLENDEVNLRTIIRRDVYMINPLFLQNTPREEPNKSYEYSIDIKAHDNAVEELLNENKKLLVTLFEEIRSK